MDKSIVDSFVNTLKDANVEDFVVFFEAGARTVRSKSESSRVIFGGNNVYYLETSDNYGSDKGRFMVGTIAYEEVAAITARDLTTQETLDIMQGLDLLDDDIKKFISVNGGSVKLSPGTGGYGERFDKEGKPVVADNLPGRVTYR